jgi:hypothetical protein
VERNCARRVRCSSLSSSQPQEEGCVAKGVSNRDLCSRCVIAINACYWDEGPYTSDPMAHLSVVTPLTISTVNSILTLKVVCWQAAHCRRWQDCADAVLQSKHQSRKVGGLFPAE